MERGTLLETLANKLHPTAISFSSKIKSIQTTPKDETLLKLDDDSLISAKVTALVVFPSSPALRVAQIHSC